MKANQMSRPNCLFAKIRDVRPTPCRLSVFVPVFTMTQSVLKQAFHKFLIFQFTAVGIFNEPNLWFEVFYDFEGA